MAAQPRAVNLVLLQALNIIPDSEYTLKEALLEFKRNLGNQAPECMFESYLWRKFINIFNQHAVIAGEEWQLKLDKLLRNEE